VFIYSYIKNCGNSCDLGTTLTNPNAIQEEIKIRLKPGNACYHSMQNILSLVCYPKI